MGKELSLQFGASLDGQHSSLPNYKAGVLTNEKRRTRNLSLIGPLPNQQPDQNKVAKPLFMIFYIEYIWFIGNFLIRYFACNPIEFFFTR
jgi:hypothetical protein